MALFLFSLSSTVRLHRAGHLAPVAVFEVDDAFGNTALIHPNIKTPHSCEMTILVNADGDVQGDDGRFYTSEEVLDYVKKEAKIQGLVP